MGCGCGCGSGEAKRDGREDDGEEGRGWEVKQKQ
jgi:hypothetical protein